MEEDMEDASTISVYHLERKVILDDCVKDFRDGLLNLQHIQTTFWCHNSFLLFLTVCLLDSSFHRLLTFQRFTFYPSRVLSTVTVIWLPIPSFFSSFSVLTVFTIFFLLSLFFSLLSFFSISLVARSVFFVLCVWSFGIRANICELKRTEGERNATQTRLGSERKEIERQGREYNRIVVFDEFVFFEQGESEIDEEENETNIRRSRRIGVTEWLRRKEKRKWDEDASHERSKWDDKQIDIHLSRDRIARNQHSSMWHQGWIVRQQDGGSKRLQLKSFWWKGKTHRHFLQYLPLFSFSCIVSKSTFRPCKIYSNERRGEADDHSFPTVLSFS